MWAKSTAKIEQGVTTFGRSRVALAGMFSAILALSLTTASFASASDDASLERLEQKFFQHTYSKDPEAQRLERVEKMVFGEAKTGPEQQRLDNLLTAVPAGDSSPDDDGAAAASRSAAASQPEETPSASPAAASAAPPRRTASKPAAKESAAAPTRDQISGTKYPSVSAIEGKLFGKDFGGEPIEERLNRLEARVFGKPSNSADLSERVDRLKQGTGVDIAVQPPSGSDWTDDDDILMPPSRSGASAPAAAPRRSNPIAGADGEDGMSFSGRNLRQDMKQAFGGSPSGSYGMGSSSSGAGFSANGSSAASGAYGFGVNDDDDDFPAAAPSAVSRYAPRSATAPNMPPAGMGLNQEVTALENEIFGKTYVKEPLPARLTRLEATVFPNDKTVGEKALPDRVSHLLAVIPISNNGRKVAQRGRNSDFSNLDDNGLPQVAPQRGGFSKIINSLGNMMGGGNNGFVGGYPAGGLITDPGTGLLYDRMTGNLIDPNTGMVVGRRISPAYGATSPYMSPGYGMGGMNMGSTYPPFNNGFSQVGGGGLHMGIGRPGLGMWP